MKIFRAKYFKKRHAKAGSFLKNFAVSNFRQNKLVLVHIHYYGHLTNDNIFPGTFSIRSSVSNKNTIN